MKKLLFFLTLLGALSAQAQVKISDLPSSAVDASTALVPIVIGGTTKQTQGRYIGWYKLDSVKTRNDSLFYYAAGGVETFASKINAGVNSFNTRTGAILPQSGDYSSFYPLLSGSYANPAWITALPWSKLTGVPATFAPSAHTHTLADLTASGAISGQVPQWNGSAWVPQSFSASTNLGNSTTASTVVVTSSSGTGTTLPAATASAAGVMTAAMVTQILKNFYFSNDLTNDTLLTAPNDSTFKFKSLNVTATNGVAVTKTIGAGTIQYALAGTAATASANGVLLSTDYKRLFTRQSMANPTGTFTVDVSAGGQCALSFTATGARTLAFSNLRAGDLVVLDVNNTSGATITLTLPTNSRVAGSGALASIVIPTGYSKLALSEYDGTNFFFALNTY